MNKLRGWKDLDGRFCWKSGVLYNSRRQHPCEPRNPANHYPTCAYIEKTTKHAKANYRSFIDRKEWDES